MHALECGPGCTFRICNVSTCLGMLEQLTLKELPCCTFTVSNMYHGMFNLIECKVIKKIHNFNFE